MSNDKNENASCGKQEASQENTPTDIAIVSHSDRADPIISAVAGGIKYLAETIDNSLQDIRNSLPADSDFQGIEAELSAIAQKLSELSISDPVIPGGPKDWVLRVYYRDIFADDETRLTCTVIERVKFPVIYWNHTSPVIADGNHPSYGHWTWKRADLVLRNGVDASGNGKTKKEHFGYWKRRATFSAAVLNAKALPSGEDITSVASRCLAEVSGEDAPFPKTYKQFCEALLAKGTNTLLLKKLQAWGYTKEVHEAYSEEFYPEGSYWTVQDWENNLCRMDEIDTHKPAGEQE